MNVEELEFTEIVVLGTSGSYKLQQYLDAKQRSIYSAVRGTWLSVAGKWLLWILPKSIRG